MVDVRIMHGGTHEVTKWTTCGMHEVRTRVTVRGIAHMRMLHVGKEGSSAAKAWPS